MLVVFPLRLLATAAIFDVLYLIVGNPAFPTVSLYMIAAGVISGLLAAIFGFIDWLGLLGNSRAKNLGLWHGIGNFVIECCLQSAGSFAVITRIWFQTALL
jgi:uncharacterized membrane protein